MKYAEICEATFIRRPNRFVAEVNLPGREESLIVHVKNTGRCRELLLPGARVVLARGGNPGRKTAFDLVGVYKAGLGLVNIDSQAPNTVMGEWLARRPEPFGDLDVIRPEHSYGQSRLDFYLERACGKRILLEVKGCTLEIAGQGYFPDAPTQRGVKHLDELAMAVKEGYECYVAFVIQMPKVRSVKPNGTTDPAFEKAFAKARKAGVKMLFLPCLVKPQKLEITGISNLSDP